MSHLKKGAGLALLWFAGWSLALGGVCKAAPLTLVRDGEPTARIVTPAEPLPVVEYAAAELRWHINQATGAKLPIVSEPEMTKGSNAAAGRAKGVSIFLGGTNHAADAGLSPGALPPDAFRIRTTGGALYLAGRDSQGKPLDVNDTAAGTLFAVYELLENELGVRWLWPGRLGTHVPNTQTVKVSSRDRRVEPAILQRKVRTLPGRRLDDSVYSKQVAGKVRHAERVWLRRHRMGMGQRLTTGGHSFTHWWPKYGEQHPEYFAMLPDGTRRPNPAKGPKNISLNWGSPKVWHRIVKNWRKQREQSEGDKPFRGENLIGAMPNDAPVRGVGPASMAMDVSGPEIEVPHDKRRQRARRMWEKHGAAYWYHKGAKKVLGSMTDRYCRFLLGVSRKARKVDPQAVVAGQAYWNTTRPPLATKLHDGILIRVAPGRYFHRFPLTKRQWGKWRGYWHGWAKTGARLYLRPNIIGTAAALYPHQSARDLIRLCRDALTHGAVGTDFDSLYGAWAAQGPYYYALGRLHSMGFNKPKQIDAETILNEYYNAFGPAKEQVKAYFKYWRWFTKHKVKPNRNQGPLLMENGHKYFTEKAFKRGRELLDRAKQAASPDATAAKRVAFLGKGLKLARLTAKYLRIQAAVSDKGDIFARAEAMQKAGVYKRYTAFREKIKGDFVANLAAIQANPTYDSRLYRLMKKLDGKRLIERLPNNWRIRFDPENRGKKAGWHKPGYDDSDWATAHPRRWKETDYGQKWKKEHGQHFDGAGWYRASFKVPESARGKKLALIFPHIDHEATIWLNGQKVARHSPDRWSWRRVVKAAPLKKAIRFDQPNVVVVRVGDYKGDNSGLLDRPALVGK